MEVMGSPRKLSHFRGFIVVGDGKCEIARIPYDEILSVVVNSYGASISNQLMQNLADRGIPLIITGSNCVPKAISLPILSHHAITERLSLQTHISEPIRKRLWQNIVQEKIARQAVVLAMCKNSAVSNVLFAMSRRVCSGDVGNVEAQAARIYFKNIFGDGFKRDRDKEGINAMLNYGYMVMRSMVARAVVACGFHPSIGLHHSSWNNTMQLVDDFIEPFRPIVDYGVYVLVKENIQSLCQEAKRVLASLASVDVACKRGMSPVFIGATEMIHSYRKVLEKEIKKLYIPAMPVENIFTDIMNTIHV